MALLEVRNLRTYFFTRRAIVKAVDGVSFSMEEGETLGLVGESGCGKTMTCLSILRLTPQPAAQIVGGQVLFDGEDLLTKNEKDMRKLRGKHISMILQDPMTSLNPVLTVGSQVAEAISLHQKVRGKVLWQRAIDALALLHIPSPRLRLRSYPHEFSGGMRQRVVGAIALACRPRLLIADECTTSLDVTIQAQYLGVLKELQEQQRLALLFITHDFGIVAQICQRVAVMYAGRIVEVGRVTDIFNQPYHPYTRALMAAVPQVDVEVDRLFSIEGQPPALHQLPQGCHFTPRCAAKDRKCRSEEFPPEVAIGPEHWVSCWQYI